MKNYKLFFVYKEAYERYVEDTKNESPIWNWEGFFENVDISDVKYKKYFKEYLREKKLERLLNF